MQRIDKLRIIRGIKIKDITLDDIERIITLIQREYGYNYPEQEFYNKSVIENYINRSIDKEGIYWKGAFYKEELIGQLIAEITHGVIYLKLAIIRNDFRRIGIMKLLSYYIERVTQYHDESDFKCVYAFITNDNIAMQNHIVKYNYVLLGKTPLYDKNKFFFIYGIIVYDYKWKICYPNIKLYDYLFQSINTARIKRFISINPYYSQKHLNNLDYNLEDLIIKPISEIFPQEFGLFNRKSEIIAKFSQNQYQKSWYDIFLLNNYNRETKQKIVKLILDEFEKNDNINSLCVPVYINDQYFQNLLLNNKFSYYAFLPFYLNGKDAILMGKSKISEINGGNDIKI